MAEVTGVAHPDERFDASETVVWSPVFQGAWDALVGHFDGRAPSVEPRNELVVKLNAFDWDKENVMPESGWKVWAGETTPGFLGSANREAARILGENEAPFDVSPQPPGSVAFLSVLKRDLSFKRKFYRSTTTGIDFRFGENEKRNVEFWGIAGSGSGSYGSLVKVLQWEAGKRSKAVEILTDGDERVVLFEPMEPMGFVEACKAVSKLKDRWRKRAGDWGGANDKSLHEKDNLRVPVLELEGGVDFADRMNGSLTFGVSMPFRVAFAKQQHHLKLDEKGAVVKVVVEGGIEPFGDPPPKPKMVSRDFVFDRPFFVFIWRDKAAWPYFGIWVGSDEGMSEFGK